MPVLSSGRRVGLDFLALRHFIQEASWGYHVEEFLAMTKIDDLYKYAAVVDGIVPKKMSSADKEEPVLVSANRLSRLTGWLPNEIPDLELFASGFTLETIWEEVSQWPLEDQKLFENFVEGEQIQKALASGLKWIMSQRDIVIVAGESLSAQKAKAVEHYFPVEWLERKITIEEAEATHLVRRRCLGRRAVPFGFINAAWRRFRCQAEPGDEIFTYSSPPRSWESLAGRAGIALMRNGKVIDSIGTIMN